MGVALQLAEVTSDPGGVTTAEISTAVDIAERLVQVGSGDVEVSGRKYILCTIHNNTDKTLIKVDMKFGTCTG